MNLTDYPTPITDAAAETRIVKNKPREIVDAEVSRDLERQLAEAIEAFSAQVEAWHEAVKQRDRLAEALRMIDTFSEEDGQCDNGYGPLYTALAALNQPEKP